MDGATYHERELLAILPEGISNRYVVRAKENPIKPVIFTYARPISKPSMRFTQDGNIYTWGWDE